MFEKGLGNRLKLFVGFFIDNRAKFIIGSIFVFVLAFILALSGILSDILVLILLMIAATLPIIYKRWIRMGIGIELMLFSTVIVGINYGPTAGFFFGLTAIAISDFMNKTIGEWSLLNMVGMGIGGVIAGSIGDQTGIFITGLASFIGVELIRQVPPLLIGGQREKLMSIIYTIIHLMFNFWLFSTIAPLLGFR